MSPFSLNNCFWQSPPVSHVWRVSRVNRRSNQCYFDPDERPKRLATSNCSCIAGIHYIHVDKGRCLTFTSSLVAVLKHYIESFAYRFLLWLPCNT
jgi:hypothetical protein